MTPNDTPTPLPREPWTTPALRTSNAAIATHNNLGGNGDGGIESTSISLV